MFEMIVIIVMGIFVVSGAGAMWWFENGPDKKRSTERKGDGQSKEEEQA